MRGRPFKRHNRIQLCRSICWLKTRMTLPKVHHDETNFYRNPIRTKFKDEKSLITYRLRVTQILSIVDRLYQWENAISYELLSISHSKWFRCHVQISSKFAPRKHRSIMLPLNNPSFWSKDQEWLVQSQHMERFFSERIWIEIWTWPLRPDWSYAWES